MIEYRDFSRFVSKIPLGYHINTEKSGIKMISPKYSADTGRRDTFKVLNRAGKTKLYDRLFTPNEWRANQYWLGLAVTSLGVEYIIGYRLMFKKDGDTIFPVIVVDDNNVVHVQMDQLMDKLETGFMKMILNSSREVVLHSELAKEFFYGPDYKFNTLGEKKMVEEMLTVKLQDYVRQTT